MIFWGEEKVDLIISLLIPKENKDNLHLTLLSKLSAKLIDDDFVSFLKTEKMKRKFAGYFKNNGVNITKDNIEVAKKCDII